MGEKILAWLSLERGDPRSKFTGEYLRVVPVCGVHLLCEWLGRSRSFAASQTMVSRDDGRERFGSIATWKTSSEIDVMPMMSWTYR